MLGINIDITGRKNSGQFRQELLYRINLMVLDLPPLRERLNDLPELAEGILRGSGMTSDFRLNDEIMRLLRKYPWPGNLRELKNILERALLLAGGASLKVEHFTGLALPHRSIPTSGTPTVHESEQAHIAAVWQQTGGNVAKATALLGISRATLYRKLKQIRA